MLFKWTHFCYLQADASCSFTLLKQTTFSLRKYGLREDQAQGLIQCISAQETYFKTNFNFQLGRDEDCEDHCASHALSDPHDRQHFEQECNLEHLKTCYQCNQLEEVIGTMLASVEDAASHGLTEDDAEELSYDINDAHKKIFNYKCHLMRSYAQNIAWEESKMGAGETTVHIIQVQNHASL